MVICLERGADLHMAQLMPLPLTVSCFSKIQIGFTFLVPAHLGSPGKRAVKRVCVCVPAYPGSPGKRPLNVCMYVCNHYLVLTFSFHSEDPFSKVTMGWTESPTGIYLGDNWSRSFTGLLSTNCLKF